MYVFYENFFLINIWQFGKKGSNITKEINSELIYNKKYLKFEKRLDTKESFQSFIYQ